MNSYSQRDERWADLGIGTPMHDYGCLVTSIAMILGKTPDRVLKALNRGDCFDRYGSLIWAAAVKVLGIKDYKWLPGSTPVTKPIIAETDHYKPRFPQHFYILNPDNSIIDPLDGQTKSPNPYNVISQRLLT